ncbi:MAG: hypothetical protein ACRELB_20080 [Polyangiaceae bacterium]
MGEPSCAQLSVASDLPVAWASAVEALHVRLAGLGAADCLPMSLSIERGEAGVRIVAITPDGRRAERAVGQPADLVPVALGLVAALPPLPKPPEPSPAASRPPVASPPASPAPPPFSARPGSASPPAPEPGRLPSVAMAPPLRVWLGLGTGVRLTAPQGLTVLDVEGRADLIRAPWLVFVTVRSAVLSCLGEQGVDCDVYEDVSAGAGLARRVRAGAALLDFGVSPSLAWMHMELDGVGEEVSARGAVVALRLDGSARLAVPFGDSVSLTVTVDAGLSPTLLASPARLSSPAGGTAPPFPTFYGGVRIGFAAAVL